MFSITDNERLRDAYALLMFMQRDISASAEKKSAVKNLAATAKMEKFFPLSMRLFSVLAILLMS